MRYVSIYDESEVNIYDGHTVKKISADVLKGWRCPRTRMLCVPLHSNFINLHKDTLFLNGPTVT